MTLWAWLAGLGILSPRSTVPVVETPPAPTDAPTVPQPIDCLAGWEPGESEFQELADRLTFVRPLVPYPGWYFDVEFDNLDLAFRMRRKIWSYCQTRQIEIPVQITWHYGIKLILLLGNDQSRQLFIGGCTEPNEFAFLDRILRPGWVFIDAGANDGWYSLFAAQRLGEAGTVWAFEPSQREFDRLARNIELNKFQNIRPYRAALSNFEGVADLSIAGHEHAGVNTLGGFVHHGITLLRKERVEVHTLDQLGRVHGMQRVDVIKMDVEGEEGRLIQGARGILENLRPILLFELSSFQPADKNNEVLDLLRSLNYELYCFDPVTGRLAPIGLAPVGDNLVAAPREKPSLD